MVYYDDYIRERAEQAFDQEKATFAVYDSDKEESTAELDDRLCEQIFSGAMCEMVSYIYRLRNEAEGGQNIEVMWDPDNVENIYITAMELSAPTIIVEYDETPEWFSMKDAELREFYWYPNPSLSGEWTAGYFQPRGR